MTVGEGSGQVPSRRLRSLDGTPINTVPPFYQLIEKMELEALQKFPLPDKEKMAGSYQRLPSEASAPSVSCGKLDVGKLQESILNDNLSRVVQLLSDTLLTTEDRHMKAGCVQTLSELSEVYHPLLYRKGWGCFSFPSFG